MNENVCGCIVPHLKGLQTEDLIQFLVEEYDGEMYLPSNYVERISNHRWVANLCTAHEFNLLLGNTLQHDRHQSMIKKVLIEREDKKLHKRNIAVDNDQHIAKILKSLKMVAGSTS